jgi:hypothetical protein
MKKIIKIIAILFILYAILLLLIDGYFSLLSLSQQTSISILINERLVPYVISIICMVYCIFRIINGHGTCDHFQDKVFDI